MNAYKVETVLAEDGMVLLKGLPFHAGEAVEIIILGQVNSHVETQSQSVVSFLDQSSSTFNQSSPLASDGEYLKAVSETMTEWYSQEDELAYADL
jgi:hypothetical protein